MARNFYIDPETKDLVIDNFNLKLTSTLGEHLAQKIENQLKTFRGEWFLNQSIGIPYYQDILKKQVNIDTVTSIFRNAILNVEGVDRIIDLSVLLDTAEREYNLTFKVKADTGEETEGEVTI